MHSQSAQKLKGMGEPFFNSEENLNSAAEYFSLFSEPIRLKILALLCQHPGEITVGEIVDRTGISQPNVSRHLSRLLLAGIVARRRSKTNAFYSLQDPFVRQLCDTVCKMLGTSKT
jgi:DNA-binding transcriptional ArsR family regulator